jgi:hypothetical protein
MEEKDRSARAEQIINEMHVQHDMRMVEWHTLIFQDDPDWPALQSLHLEMYELERMLEALEAGEVELQ